ncbi:MAG: hypothetical protein ACRDPM_23055, partial [Solirubrobacteraceae bacterium]
MSHFDDRFGALRWRSCAAALIVILVLGVVALATWPGPRLADAAMPSACGGPVVTITYSGSYSDVEQNPTADGYTELASRSISFQWSDTVTGPIDGTSGHPECFPSKD